MFPPVSLGIVPWKYELNVASYVYSLAAKPIQGYSPLPEDTIWLYGDGVAMCFGDLEEIAYGS